MTYSQLEIMTLCNSMDCSILCPWNSLGKNIGVEKKKEYWSGWPISFSRDLPDLGIELGSPTLQADSKPVGSPNILIKPQRY